ncbi:MAG: putative lipid II flippase FtsW [bacterium]
MKAKRYHSPDLSMMFAVFFLIFFGLIMIYSSSAIVANDSYNDFSYFLKKQIIWVLLGSVLMFIFINVDYKQWKQAVIPIYMLTIILLVLVLFVGKSVGGAQRWLSLGAVNFQPSELAKISTILMLAYFIDRKRSKMDTLSKGIIPGLIIMGLPIVLILAEPDLGIPFIIASVGLVMLFIGGARFVHLSGIVVVSAPFLLGLIFVYSYRWKRLISFINPWDDPQGSGYQIIQSLLAFGSGGFAGKGLGGSTMKLLYLPTPYTDFIFPIIGEELGFVGCLGLIVLFVFFSIRGLAVARKADTLFGSLVCAGLVFAISFQALINMAVSTGMLPTKGISLPFLSFGGSSLVLTMAAVGMILNISRQSKL